MKKPDKVIERKDTGKTIVEGGDIPVKNINKFKLHTHIDIDKIEKDIISKRIHNGLKT